MGEHLWMFLLSLNIVVLQGFNLILHARQEFSDIFWVNYAQEYAVNGIRINAICPGMIVSSMTDKLSEKMKQYALSKITLKRF